MPCEGTHLQGDAEGAFMGKEESIGQRWVFLEMGWGAVVTKVSQFKCGRCAVRGVSLGISNLFWLGGEMGS